MSKKSCTFLYSENGQDFLVMNKPNFSPFLITLFLRGKHSYSTFTGEDARPATEHAFAVVDGGSGAYNINSFLRCSVHNFILAYWHHLWHIVFLSLSVKKVLVYNNIELSFSHGIDM